MQTQQLLIAGAIAMALSGTAFAQQQTPAQAQQRGDDAKVTVVKGDQATTTSPDQASASPYDLRASDIIGREVRNSQDEDIGDVDDLVISRKDNVMQAVISVGGFLGMGEKLVAVPYDQVKVDANQDYVLYDATKEQLESQPEFNYREGESRWMTGEAGEQYRRGATAGTQTPGQDVDQAKLEEEREDVQEERKDVQEEMKDVREEQQDVEKAKR